MYKKFMLMNIVKSNVLNDNRIIAPTNNNVLCKLINVALHYMVNHSITVL